MKLATAILVLAVIGLTAPVHAQTTRYVDESATGANNGTSWTDAYVTLQLALNVAQSGDEIWVAEGTYHPDDLNPGSILETFSLDTDYSVYGGFPAGGGDGTFAARDFNQFVTILSGDILGDDGPNFTNYGDNSRHVVTVPPGNLGVVLDGVTITAGFANGPQGIERQGAGMLIHDGSSPCVVNCTFVANLGNLGNGCGGGLYCGSGATEIISCRFLGNRSGSGGAICVELALITNCIFSGNSCNAFGAAIAHVGINSLLVTCCTFSGNTNSSSLAGGIWFGSSTNLPPVVYNCIFWDNPDSGGNGESSQLDVSSSGTLPDVQSCIIQGMVPNGQFDTGSNSGANPLLVDPDGLDNVAGTLDDDLRLGCLSPAIDTGNLSLGLTELTDFEGDPRVSLQALDRGADEALPVHPGTGEDLVLATSVNGVCPSTGVVTASPGDTILIHLLSPGGTFDGEVPLVLGQLFTTGSPLSSPFPGIVVDPFVMPGPFIVFDGNAGGAFGVFNLPPQGLVLQAAMPAGLSGASILLQGLSVTGPTANGIFAGTNGSEIQG